MTAAATAEARTWIGLEAAARRLHGSKTSDETADIAVTVAVQTGLGGNGNGSSMRRELGLTITTKRWQRDDSNGGSNGFGASLALFGDSGWDKKIQVPCMVRDVRTITT